MEQKIMEVLRKMQEHLKEDQLKLLRDCLEMVLGGCQITETTAVSAPERSWVNDLEDFLVSNILQPLGSRVYLLFCTSRYGWGWKNFSFEGAFATFKRGLSSSGHNDT